MGARTRSRALTSYVYRGDINDTARAIKCIDKNADRLMCKIEAVSITISGLVGTGPASADRKFRSS